MGLVLEHARRRFLEIEASPLVYDLDREQAVPNVDRELDVPSASSSYACRMAFEHASVTASLRSASVSSSIPWYAGDPREDEPAQRQVLRLGRELQGGRRGAVRSVVIHLRLLDRFAHRVERTADQARDVHLRDADLDARSATGVSPSTNRSCDDLPLALRRAPRTRGRAARSSAVCEPSSSTLPSRCSRIEARCRRRRATSSVLGR